MDNTMNITTYIEDFQKLTGLNIMRIPFVIILIIIAYFVYKSVFNLIEKLLAKTKIDKHLSNIINNIIKFILIFILVVLISGYLGIDTTSIIAVFSLFGLAISLAVQNIMSNFAYAISIIINKPYKEGDYIKVNNYEGTVEEITMINTKILTVNNEMIYIPNLTIGSNTIINYTALPIRRIEIILDAFYNDEIDKVKSVIRNTINEEPLVLKDQDIFIEIHSFATSSIKYLIRVYCKKENYLKCKHSLLANFKINFDNNNITIPYQTITIAE